MKFQKRKDGTIKVTAQSKEDSKQLYNWLAGVDKGDKKNEGKKFIEPLQLPNSEEISEPLPKKEK